LLGLRGQLRTASAAGAKWLGKHDWRNQQGQTHGEKMLAAIAAAGGQHWFAFYQDVTPDTMACATRLKLGVSAWSVNELADMERLERLGVSAIITDRPDLMRGLPEIQK
ncbi:MAG: glycerophosphodiester phosphodiesterase family protein, partial [Pseudomonadota bacterium]|nr:glycerophosphodiester phosphodiesterase family protein [Pseudomonadota bacterium]